MGSLGDLGVRIHSAVSSMYCSAPLLPVGALSVASSISPSLLSVLVLTQQQ